MTGRDSDYLHSAEDNGNNNYFDLLLIYKLPYLYYCYAMRMRKAFIPKIPKKHWSHRGKNKNIIIFNECFYRQIFHSLIFSFSNSSSNLAIIALVS